MNIEENSQSTDLKTVVDYLHKETERLLIDRGVWPIISLGWLNEYEPDPEYLGYAIYATDHPLELPLFEPSKSTIIKPISNLDKDLTVKITDFEAVCDAIRELIGSALIYEKLAKLNFGNAISKYDKQFWMYYINSAQLLNIASDRLRDILISGFFRKNTKKYNSKLPEKERRNPFRIPFFNIHDEVNKHHEWKYNSHIILAADKLLPVADKLYRYRERRNSIVHKATTKIALKTQERIEAFQKEYDCRQKNLTCSLPPVSDQASSYKDFQQKIKIIEDKYYKEISNAIVMLIDWYSNLLKAGSLIYEIEYWKRISQS